MISGTCGRVSTLDGCITEAPGGGECAGRSLVDRGKQGMTRSSMTDGYGIAPDRMLAGANRHDSPLLAGTLDKLADLGPSGDLADDERAARADHPLMWGAQRDRRNGPPVRGYALPPPRQAPRRLGQPGQRAAVVSAKDSAKTGPRSSPGSLSPKVPVPSKAGYATKVHCHGRLVSAVRSVTVNRTQDAPAADHRGLENPPGVIGIVNITEDSFSDGGRYLDTGNALSHARRLRSEGADIIELGPAASHPDSARVTASNSRGGTAAASSGPRAAGGGRYPYLGGLVPTETQRFAISSGVTYLNDIQGFPHPSLYDALAESGCRLIVMHSVQRIGPATKIITDPTEVWSGIDRFFARRLDALAGAGIAQDRLIIDPGLGYFLGSNPEPSLAALAGIPALRARFGVPVLVSPSRKSFLRTLTGRDIAHAGSATLAAELYAACCHAKGPTTSAPVTSWHSAVDSPS